MSLMGEIGADLLRVWEVLGEGGGDGESILSTCWRKVSISSNNWEIFGGSGTLISKVGIVLRCMGIDLDWIDMVFNGTFSSLFGGIICVTEIDAVSGVV